MLQFNRHFQKLAILIVLLFFTSLLYFHQTAVPYIQQQLPQNTQYHQQAQSRNYSIKPIAYIFPQYYVFEDNNRLHGQNFTEWVNVKKVTHNAFGLETIRPHESIGFYNGLELATRQRQGKFLLDGGFHGAVFHHYWFAGRPVMDHVIQAMLEDGEPNIPFMLSWANEPWSERWNGAHGKVLIAQEYGLQVAWRKHFDWLLPFFRHPRYIRSDGKIQFVVYNPSHAGHIGPQMFAAWRQWAVEEGLGGLDIIETRWGEGSPQGPDTWAAFPPDAINEFAPHAGGRDQARYPSIKRMSRVYHRGTLACWDTTPRHPTDGLAAALATCHPKTWQNHLVEMFRKIKSDPNPIGSENFFFVNALNEWGEGNSIETSAQFGDGYKIAMKSALEISEKEHAWADVSTEVGFARDTEMETIMNKTADVCVLISASPQNAEEKIFTLSRMLRSLQAQQNKNWRAVVFQPDRSEYADLSQVVIQALDARIRHGQVPKDVNLPTGKGKDSGFVAVDWLIQNLTTLDPGCASAAYLLIADGSTTYEPSAFSHLSPSEDLISLNVESRQHIWDHPQAQNQSWENRCSWLEQPNLDLCHPSAPTLAAFELTATFINFKRFQAEGHLLDDFRKTLPANPAGAMAEYLSGERQWSHVQLGGSDCHVRHNPAYTSCLKTGNFWLDSPIFEETGCYTTSDLTRVFEQMPNLKGFDLLYFRAHGQCVRYKEDMYLRVLAKITASAATTSADPVSSPTPVAPAKSAPVASDRSPAPAATSLKGPGVAVTDTTNNTGAGSTEKQHAT